MYTKSLPFIQDPKEHGIKTMIIASVLLHIFFIASTFIYPLLNKPKSSPLMVIEMVQLEKPKIRPIQKKSIKPQVKKKPIPKPEAPKLTNKPKPVVKPPKKEPREVKKKPDTTKIEKLEEKVLETMVPRIVLNEKGDPRLQYWIRRVQKKIQNRWNPPGGIGIIGQSEVAVVFTVIRSGQITKIDVGKSSGNKDLDGFALNTIERIGNMPPIPGNYRDKEKLVIRFIFPYIGN